MKKYRFLLLICLVFIITGCSFSVEVSKKSISNKDNTSETIPNIVGLTEEDATSILELNGFEIGEVFLINNDKYEDGLVVKSEPEFGVVTKKGTVVNLYIASNSSYEVEDFTGKNYIEVKTKLEYLGIIVEVREKSYITLYEDLTIVEQEPSVGTKLNEGDKVILYIPKLEELYPDFVQEEWKISEVEEFCDTYNINLIIKYEKSSKLEDTIIGQSAKPGSKIVSNTNLTITVSRG
ncbi:MAG: PASTA domain-containing protein [Firmicutes bacterium]|nr:PASTA domain-containing protein [Bacillota bacterium]